MKYYVFSDHTGEQIAQQSNDRQAAYQAEVAAYQAACDARTAESAAKRREAAEALREGDLFWAIRRWFSSLFCFERALPPVPQPPAVTDTERKWRAGNTGEALLSTALASHLDDRWTLVSGYENDRGELDQVLIGPSGVITLEAKYMTGDIELVREDCERTVFRDGQHRREKIADRRGRSPVRQVTDITDCMVEALRGKWPTLQPRRAVVFTHPHGRLVRVENLPPLTYAMSLVHWDLTTLAAEQPVFDAPPADEFVRALYEHHKACLRRKTEREKRKAASRAKARGARDRSTAWEP